MNDNIFEIIDKLNENNPNYPRKMTLGQYSGWDKRIEKLTAALSRLHDVIEKNTRDSRKTGTK